MEDKKGKSPAFQFYPKDWMTDINIVMMTAEERGLYIVALCHDWLEDGLHEDHLLKLCATSKGTSRLVQERFTPHPSNLGKFTNPRLQKEREKQKDWKEKCRRGGVNSGKTRSYLPKVTSDLLPSKREVKGNSPSSSSSTSSSNIDHKEKEVVVDTYMTSLPEKIKPKFDPTGKTKYLEWVYLSQEQFDRVRTYYQEKGLGVDILKEAIRELDRWFDNNPKMRLTRTDDAKALMGWPLNEALKRSRELKYHKKSEENF